MNEYNLLDACLNCPHYGLLNGLENILKYARGCAAPIESELVTQIMSLCFSAAKYAETVVNSSSPEGSAYLFTSLTIDEPLTKTKQS